MLKSQKSICIIQHNNNKLPILEYMDKSQFLALSLSGGVIVWVYRGSAMLIPAARIANLATVVEANHKLESQKIKPLNPVFTTADVIVLPEKIADALLGDDK